MLIHLDPIVHAWVIEFFWWSAWVSKWKYRKRRWRRCKHLFARLNISRFQAIHQWQIWILDGVGLFLLIVFQLRFDDWKLLRNQVDQIRNRQGHQHDHCQVNRVLHSLRFSPILQTAKSCLQTKSQIRSKICKSKYKELAISLIISSQTHSLANNPAPKPKYKTQNDTQRNM